MRFLAMFYHSLQQKAQRLILLFERASLGFELAHAQDQSPDRRGSTRVETRPFAEYFASRDTYRPCRQKPSTRTAN